MRNLTFALMAAALISGCGDTNPTMDGEAIHATGDIRVAVPAEMPVEYSDVIGIDLVPVGLRVDSDDPTTGRVGIRVEIHNQGTEGSGDCYGMRLVINGPERRDGEADCVFTVPPPGSANGLHWDWPCYTPGNYTAMLVIDAIDAIPEGHEQNNAALVEYHVRAE